jgi:hypothetical protein
MPAYERINAVVSLTLIGLALYFVLDFPAQTATFTLFGSPLEIESPRQWLMVLLLGGMAATGTDTVIRAHPGLPVRHTGFLMTFWSLPALLIILATQTLGLAPTLIIWAVGLAVFGALLWSTIYTEYQQIPSPAAGKLWTRLWLQFIGYAVVLIFFIVIYQTRSRSAVSATGTLIVSSVAALGLLRYSPAEIGKTWLFAAVIGLCMGQITWALNYWRTGALNAGLLLFLIFYLLVGLAQQQLLGSITRRTLWEFGAIASIGLVVIYYL